MDLSVVLKSFNHSFTLFVVFPAIIASGFYLTLKLRFVQISHLKKSFSFLVKRNTKHEGNISHFGAVASVLAGNLGTGNISGMAVAIATGGPGALVWMWLMVFFGSTIQYASCVLGISFRTKNSAGEYVGGPMYYLRDGLGFKKLAAMFAVFTLFGAVTVGNLAQINSVVLPLEKLGLNAFYCSLAIATVVGLVILGGIKRIAQVATFIVPFMAFLYLGTASIIIFSHYDQVWDAFKLMFQHAFGYSALVGGVFGAGVLKAITTGFDRGLFATDAGTGIVPILQASAKSEHPIVDGIATLVAPFLVMIICTATGLVLILTGAWQEAGLVSTNMVTHAFSVGLNHSFGGYVVMFALILFAFTTIMAWCYCAEKAQYFLSGTKYRNPFRWAYIALVPVGSLMNVELVWVLADIAITFMLSINLIGVMGLCRHVVESSKEYKKTRRLQESSLN